jgi:hypothetical protein
MDIRFGIEGSGRWLSLAMTIGKASLASSKVIGFVCKTDAPVATTFRACVRSGMATGHKDVYFNKTIVAYPATSVHMDAMELDGNSDIPEQAPWRELLLFFKREPSALSLRDLRVAEVIKTDMKVENGKVTAYRTRVSLSFKYEA